MSATPSSAPDSGTLASSQDLSAPTVASFSPVSPLRPGSGTRQRSTILVQQKSPLLVATPPQITRALAYSHPFLLPLNQLAGLLSWTSGDAWESFIVMAIFWATVLYGDVVIRWGGPLVMVVGLVAGMHSRRYSPLSSTGWLGKMSGGSTSKKDPAQDGSTTHQKSLDEIVDTLNVFTSRCNVLMDPFIRLADFLTQQSASSALVRTPLSTLLIRILMLTPLWFVLTLPPLQLITTRGIILTFGTVGLSWHSRPAKVTRAILWRSKLFRRLSSAVTGLALADPPQAESTSPSESSSPSLVPRSLRSRNANDSAAALAARTRLGSAEVCFTFIIYENQRRWLGLGWTHSLFAYERAPWTDEHLNPSPSKDDFELPKVEGESATWRWAQGSEWRVEGAGEGEEGGTRGASKNRGGGWIYYDNKVSIAVDTSPVG